MGPVTMKSLEQERLRNWLYSNYCRQIVHEWLLSQAWSPKTQRPKRLQRAIASEALFFRQFLPNPQVCLSLLTSWHLGASLCPGTSSEHLGASLYPGTSSQGFDDQDLILIRPAAQCMLSRVSK